MGAFKQITPVKLTHILNLFQEIGGMNLAGHFMHIVVIFITKIILSQRGSKNSAR